MKTVINAVAYGVLLAVYVPIMAIKRLLGRG